MNIILKYFPPIAIILTSLASCDGSGNQAPQNNTPDPSAKAQKAYNLSPDKVVGLAEVQPEGKTVNLFPQVQATITAVNVKLGDKVKKGQVLFELDHASQDATIAAIYAQLEGQKATVQSLQANIVKAEATLSISQKNYARSKQVFDQGAGTKQDLDNMEATLKTAQADLNSLQANLLGAKAQLGVLQANLQLAKVERDKYFIKAPTDGVMQQVDAVLGGLATQATPFGQFAADSPTDVVTEIDELFADKVQVNQRAFIRLQGGTDTIATGVVIELAPSLRQKSLFSDELGQLEDRRVREVRVRLEKGQENVLYGQRVECEIDVKTNNQN